MAHDPQSDPADDGWPVWFWALVIAIIFLPAAI
jgi:hypothetical protein